MTQADRFMRTSIKRRFSLTTLLQVSRLVKDLREDEMDMKALKITVDTVKLFCMAVIYRRNWTDEGGAS